MHVLLLSDIHSNLEALEACLAAAPAYDVAVNLGDVVGYGASPNEVIDRSRNLGKFFVRGNHDKAAAGLTELKEFNPIAGLAAIWTRDQERGLEVARRVETGSIGVNFFDLYLGAPFGGVKASGLGRELGPEGLDAYVSLKSIYLNS